MNARNLVAGCVCLGCLVFGGLSLSQERNDLRKRVSETNSDKLERRVMELEKQVRSLSQDLETLRREVHPNATRAARPKPL